MNPEHKILSEQIDAALGNLPCDTVFQNARVLDVFTGTFLPRNIGIKHGLIACVEPLDTKISGHRIFDLKHKAVVPGFIDAHVHVESSLLTPLSFDKLVLPYGTTSAVCDPHELANVQGVEGIRYFTEASNHTQMDLYVMASSCVPATNMETNGGGELRADLLAEFASHPNVLGLAEMMNVPGVLLKDPSVLDKIHLFSGKPLDGHAPLVKGRELSAYIGCGISSCHESSEKDEALEKLQKGMSVWIREGSVAKDLHALSALLNINTCASMGFCTDDRNPLDIAEEGHLDYLIRTAIRYGVPPEVAYKAASYSVARHYGLCGPYRKTRHQVGAIAPGFQADLVVLGDLASCAISEVFKRGTQTSELSFSEAKESGKYTEAEVAKATNSILAHIPSEEALEGKKGMVHVMVVKPGKIITDRTVLPHDAKGVSKITVLERHGHHLPPANAYVLGFGELTGAIASSVGHDCHNLITVGTRTKDMSFALRALKDLGGGFCVVKDGAVLASLSLPFGGLMTSEAPKEITKKLRALREASKQIGCVLHEPFLQLAFLSLPVIPSLKLTDKGLVDVDAFQIIDVCAS